MEVILSDRVKSFTGSLGDGLGYSIRRRGKRFFSMRNPKGFVPIDGQLQFIFACAELAQSGLHIADIAVSCAELKHALDDAMIVFYPDRLVKAPNSEVWNAAQVRNLKQSIINCSTL